MAIIDISFPSLSFSNVANLIGVVALSGTVIKITKNYVSRTIKNSNDKPMYSAYEDIQKEQENL